MLACAAYVDLNPIRAAMAQTLETSDFTSVQRRIESLVKEQCDAPAIKQPGVNQAPDPEDSRLVSVGIVNQTRPVEVPSFLSPVEIDEQNDEAGPCASATGQRCSDKGFLPMSLASYLELLDWTARQFVAGKSGVTPESSPPIFSRLKIREEVFPSRNCLMRFRLRASNPSPH